MHFYKRHSYSKTKDIPRGLQFYSQPPNVKGHDEMTLSYEVYFASNFGWVYGGKLPGLFGGEMTCSGHRDTEHCFSTRMMWRRHGDGECYAYIPHEQSPDYNHWCDDNNDVKCNNHSGQSLGRSRFTFHHNK